MTAPLLPPVRPRRLVGGDRVAVVAPSGPVVPERLDAGVALLESWGLEVVIGDHARDQTGHLAGADADRAADLTAAWCDPQVAAVLGARGGSGCARLVDDLDWDRMRSAGPKVFVGFSDATVLHQAIALELGLVTLYGPVVAAVTFAGPEADPATAEHLRLSLFEPERATGLTGSNGSPGRSGEVARGLIGGGTLTLLAASAGTRSATPAQGALVVLEDIGEPIWRLDRALTQLLRSGYFDGARGVALGTWRDCEDAAAEFLMDRLAGALGVPTVAGLPVGHGSPQLTVPFGVPAELDAGSARLTWAPALA
jgi:muramoyltetrapeptide carboxypeptidase